MDPFPKIVLHKWYSVMHEEERWEEEFRSVPLLQYVSAGEWSVFVVLHPVLARLRMDYHVLYGAQLDESRCRRDSLWPCAWGCGSLLVMLLCHQIVNLWFWKSRLALQACRDQIKKDYSVYNSSHGACHVYNVFSWGDFSGTSCRCQDVDSGNPNALVVFHILATHLHHEQVARVWDEKATMQPLCVHSHLLLNVYHGSIVQKPEHIWWAWGSIHVTKQGTLITSQIEKWVAWNSFSSGQLPAVHHQFQ